MSRPPEPRPAPAPTARAAAARPATPPGVQGRWARRAAGGLIGVSVLLAAWSFVLPFVFGLGPRQVPWWREVFDVNHEANLTAWWSSGLLLLGAAGFTTVGLVRRALGADRRRSLLAWLTPAALLAAMSWDESTQIHEHAGQLWEALPFAGENPLPAFQWLILGVPAAIVVLGLLALCTVALPRRTRALTVAGGAVFFFGAIVLEAVPLVFGIGRSTLAYHVATHAEELTEMIGASVLVVAPWAHLHLRPAPGHLQVTADGVPDVGADDVVLGAGPGPAARLDDCD
ncbi:hypothetical protein [Micrococcus luteus]|uniref:hypothetical protein n=1 Tax=Micrococcus luteus TaxID=1270 RepID=UPI0020B3BA78|nr:hypothetical protein [Micrococcus luteus]